MDKVMIAPSTDPIKTIDGMIEYANEIASMADFLHCDIMDGVFVKNKTYSFDTLKELNNNTLIMLDVHLMVSEPSKIIDKFIRSGANILTVHYESYKNKAKLIKDLKYIQKKGVLSGLSINPNTQVSEISEYLCFCDVVLIMGVEPGKSGQEMRDCTFAKVNQLNLIKADYHSNLKIEVDGGVNPENAQRLKYLGAQILVSGSYVYNSKNRQQAIDSLR